MTIPLSTGPGWHLMIILADRHSSGGKNLLIALNNLFMLMTWIYICWPLLRHCFLSISTCICDGRTAPDSSKAEFLISSPSSWSSGLSHIRCVCHIAFSLDKRAVKGYNWCVVPHHKRSTSRYGFKGPIVTCWKWPWVSCQSFTDMCLPSLMQILRDDCVHS